MSKAQQPVDQPRADQKKIAVFDTTLRDGEQAAGTRLGSRDKLTLAGNWRDCGLT